LKLPPCSIDVDRMQCSAQFVICREDVFDGSDVILRLSL
jgi:hypothetical protein